MNGLKKLVCNKWRVFTPLSIEISYTEEFKRSVIVTNSDLQSLAAFYSGKKCATVEICVRLVETSEIIVASGDASNIFINYCGDRTESRGIVLKSITCSDVFREVGQIFEGGAVELRHKLIMYAIETGYKYKTNINLYIMIVVELQLSALRKNILVANEGFMFLLC